MNAYLYIEINIFAILILILIYANLNRTEKFMTEQILYIHIILFTIIILVFDTFMWAFDHIDTVIFRVALPLSTLIYFLLQPVICLLWSLYVDYQINRSRHKLFRLLIPMMLPVIINAVLSLISLYYNIYFYFDNANSYHRGQYFLLMPALSFTYIIYSMINLMKNRSRISDQYFKVFISFALPPIIGTVIQVLFYGLSLIWLGMTLSVFIIFINIQNQQMYCDYLTGLFNRRQLDFYLQDIILKKKFTVAGILLDFNSFKNVNDCYGHTAGDEALKLTAHILRKSFKQHSFISRFGGDEFVVLLEVKDRTELDQVIDTFRSIVKQFNEENTLPYKIDYSIGADIYPADSNMTGQEFLHHIDSLMYKEKNSLSRLPDAYPVCSNLKET